MKAGEKFYILFVFIAIVSCKQGGRENSTPRDLSVNTGQYSQLVLDNVFENELHFPSEYRVMNMDGNPVSLKSLLNSPKIVIRLHESYCENCIVEQVQIINSALQNPKDVIIGLATYSNIRKFRILLDKYKIEFPVYFIPYGDSNLLFSTINERNYLPFYFIIDTDLNSRYFFHTHVSFPEVTMEYLKRSKALLTEEEKQSYPLFIDKRNLSMDNALLSNTYDIEIPYRNITSENVQIDSIKVSCDCLQLISYDRLVAPMGRGKLVLTYEPTDIGFDQKEIRIAIKDHGDVSVNFQAYITD